MLKKTLNTRKVMLWEMPFFHGTLNKKYTNMKYEYYSIGGVFPISNKLLNW
jgi:hypothetical protein